MRIDIIIINLGDKILKIYYLISFIKYKISCFQYTTTGIKKTLKIA